MNASLIKADMGVAINNYTFFTLWMVKKYKRQLGSRKYKDYSEDAIKEATQKVKNEEMSMNAASKTYKIPIGTLSNKLRGLHEKK